VTSGKCGTPSWNATSFADEDAAHVVSCQLGDQRCHVPAAATTDTEAVLCRRDRAKAVPLHLKPVIADRQCRTGDVVGSGLCIAQTARVCRSALSRPPAPFRRFTLGGVFGRC
jgi:hypothetical protein